MCHRVSEQQRETLGVTQCQSVSRGRDIRIRHRNDINSPVKVLLKYFLISTYNFIRVIVGEEVIVNSGENVKLFSLSFVHSFVYGSGKLRRCV